MHGSRAALVGAVGNFFDKEKRKNNLVVHNLPESKAQDPKERASKDMDAIKDLIRGEFHLNADISKAFRAGKLLQDKPRPLVVTLSDEATKWEILRLAPNSEDLPSMMMCSSLRIALLKRGNGIARYALRRRNFERRVKKCVSIGVRWL